MNNEIEFTWPFVTQGTVMGTTAGEEDRFWLHPEPPVFYLYQVQNGPQNGPLRGMWVTIDRRSDRICGKPRKTIRGAVAQFKAWSKNKK